MTDAELIKIVDDGADMVYSKKPIKTESDILEAFDDFIAYVNKTLEASGARIRLIGNTRFVDIPQEHLDLGFVGFSDGRYLITLEDGSAKVLQGRIKDVN